MQTEYVFAVEVTTLQEGTEETTMALVGSSNPAAPTAREVMEQHPHPDYVVSMKLAIDGPVYALHNGVWPV